MANKQQEPERRTITVSQWRLGALLVSFAFAFLCWVSIKNAQTYRLVLKAGTDKTSWQLQVRKGVLAPSGSRIAKYGRSPDKPSPQFQIPAYAKSLDLKAKRSPLESIAIVGKKPFEKKLVERLMHYALHGLQQKGKVRKKAKGLFSQIKEALVVPTSLIKKARAASSPTVLPRLLIQPAKMLQHWKHQVRTLEIKMKRWPLKQRPAAFGRWQRELQKLKQLLSGASKSVVCPRQVQKACPQCCPCPKKATTGRPSRKKKKAASKKRPPVVRPVKR